jgi:DNA (cytosine-5)-methyltransferase 1
MEKKMIGSQYLTLTSAAALYTAPGQADFADPSSPYVCGGCEHFESKSGFKVHCLEYRRRMGGRQGAELKAAQKACRVFLQKGETPPQRAFVPAVDLIIEPESETVSLRSPPGKRAFLEFFSGGGMARLGFGPGWACVFANDIDPKKAAPYIANFGREHLRICGVEKVNVQDLPGYQVDCAWMSAPCIGHSEAGNRQGFAERESGSFWSSWRLVEALNRKGRAPRMIVFENVTGIKDREGALDEVREAYEREDYAHATLTIDAAQFLPQSRDRVFVVGVRRELGVDVGALVERAWAELRALPPRTSSLIDILEPDAPWMEWRSRAEAERHLGMMSAVNLAKVEAARAAGRPIVGAFYRRIREDSEGVKTQRAEIRFDGVAGALRNASKGGRAFNSF